MSGAADKVRLPTDEICQASLAEDDDDDVINAYTIFGGISMSTSLDILRGETTVIAWLLFGQSWVVQQRWMLV